MNQNRFAVYIHEKNKNNIPRFLCDCCTDIVIGLSSYVFGGVQNMFDLREGDISSISGSKRNDGLIAPHIYCPSSSSSSSSNFTIYPQAIIKFPRLRDFLKRTTTRIFPSVFENNHRKQVIIQTIIPEIRIFGSNTHSSNNSSWWRYKLHHYHNQLGEGCYYHYHCRHLPSLLLCLFAHFIFTGATLLRLLLLFRSSCVIFLKNFCRCPPKKEKSRFVFLGKENGNISMVFGGYSVAFFSIFFFFFAGFRFPSQIKNDSSILFFLYPSSSPHYSISSWISSRFLLPHPHPNPKKLRLNLQLEEDATTIINIGVDDTKSARIEEKKENDEEFGSFFKHHGERPSSSDHISLFGLEKWSRRRPSDDDDQSSLNPRFNFSSSFSSAASDNVAVAAVYIKNMVGRGGSAIFADAAEVANNNDTNAKCLLNCESCNFCFLVFALFMFYY